MSECGVPTKAAMVERELILGNVHRKINVRCLTLISKAHMCAFIVYVYANNRACRPVPWVCWNIYWLIVFLPSSAWEKVWCYCVCVCVCVSCYVLSCLCTLYQVWSFVRGRGRGEREGESGEWRVESGGKQPCMHLVAGCRLSAWDDSNIIILESFVSNLWTLTQHDRLAIRCARPMRWTVETKEGFLFRH